MPQFIKAIRIVFCSILFISMTAFGSSLKTGNMQSSDSDNLREVLKKAHSALEGIKSFRTRVDLSKTVAPIWEYASPDRARLIWENEELIRIGKTYFHKKNDGSWEKFPERENVEFKTDYPGKVLKQYIEAIEKADEVKFIGRETVNGIPALAYEHTKYRNPNKTDPFTTKTWFNEADGLLLKNQCYCFMRGSMPSPVDYIFYDYNADIKIEPPTEYVTITVPEGSKGIRVPEGEFLYFSEPIGVPKGTPGLPSAGPDERGGLGTGKGGGIGPGDGTGLGPGRGINTTGGKPSPNVPATSVDQRPVALNAPRPNYTEAARNNKIQGVVRVRVLVGTDGSVKQVRVTSGLPDGLNEEAIRSAYQIRFKPAMKDGQPVSYWVGVDIEFNLGDKVK